MKPNEKNGSNEAVSIYKYTSALVLFQHLSSLRDDLVFDSQARASPMSV